MSKRTNYVDGFNKPAKLSAAVRTITHETKARLYNEGNYSCRLNVPVCTIMWDDQSWIKWADNSGRWWLDDCYWEKVKGEVDQYKCCGSSGFIERWNKAKDDHVTKGYEAPRNETLPTLEHMKEHLK